MTDLTPDPDTTPPPEAPAPSPQPDCDRTPTTATNFPWKLLIFDCDGVLVDSEPIGNRVFSEMVGELGVDLPSETAERMFRGGQLAECLAFIEQQRGQPVPTDFIPQFRQRSADAFRKHLKPIPGIHTALEQLQIPMCVASNGPREKMELTLALTELLPWFANRMFSAYDIDSWKPRPDLFLHAAEQHQTHARDCAVIEDSVFGAQAALAAGMTAFVYTPDHRRAEFDELQVTLFDDMRDLPALLGLC